MTNASPVGFFDSGIGGLCIRDAFARICPEESTVYIADSAHCPYGNRPADEILRLAREHSRRLRDEFGCKMVVVACNTATAAAIDVLRVESPDFPFVGVEPAIKPAALNSRTGIVGVLATAGTFDGRLYRETKSKFANNVKVIATVADEFVTLVENGDLSSPEAENTVRERISPLLDAGCDRIVLGCTHFPHLKSLIEKVCRKRAEVVDSTEAVAERARFLLDEMHLNAVGNPDPFHLLVRTK